MDCRNVKTPAPEIQDGKYLEKMFELQKELMEGYYNIEGLPHPPLNINSKNAQVILKDMASRSVEELAEGYESTHLACEIMEKYGWNKDIIPENEYQMLLNHLQNSCEEQADAVAFMLELLIYAGITEGHLKDWAWEKSLKMNPYLDPNMPLLDLIMGLGISLLFEFNPLMTENLATVCPEHLYCLVDSDNPIKEHIPAFNWLSTLAHHHEMTYLWQIQYHIGVGRNYLKNKPWKQTGELSDEDLYFENLYMAVCKMFGYQSIMGFTPESLYKMFWKKHCVNEFRIRSGY